MARISLIDEKLDWQNNGRNIILFDVYFGKFFNCNILIMILYSGSNEKKNCGDTPSATLSLGSNADSNYMIQYNVLHYYIKVLIFNKAWEWEVGNPAGSKQAVYGLQKGFNTYIRIYSKATVFLEKAPPPPPLNAIYLFFSKKPYQLGF